MNLVTHRQNIQVPGEEPEFFRAHKIADLREFLHGAFGARTPARILDFGTGNGNSLPYFRRSTCALVGGDVSSRNLDIARAQGVEGADLVMIDGVNHPFDV